MQRILTQPEIASIWIQFAARMAACAPAGECAVGTMVKIQAMMPNGVLAPSPSDSPLLREAWTEMLDHLGVLAEVAAFASTAATTLARMISDERCVVDMSVAVALKGKAN